MIEMKDPIGKFYPDAKKAMAKEPFYSIYPTYTQWQNFVTKYTGSDELGYHGHQMEIYDPVSYETIGIIRLAVHNLTGNVPEYEVSYNATSYAMKSKWFRPIETYWLDDMDTAFALMVAVSYPWMEMEEAILTCPANKDAAIKKYLEIVPKWCNFTEEQMKGFVKNLETP